MGGLAVAEGPRSAVLFADCRYRYLFLGAGAGWRCVESLRRALPAPAAAAAAAACD